jgi:hypothetical protein
MIYSDDSTEKTSSGVDLKLLRPSSAHSKAFRHHSFMEQAMESWLSAVAQLSQSYPFSFAQRDQMCKGIAATKFRHIAQKTISPANVEEFLDIELLLLPPISLRHLMEAS